MEALKSQLTDLLQLKVMFDGRAHFGVYKNLAIRCLITKPGCKIGHSSGCGVLKSALEPDAAERCVAACNADTKPKLVPGGLPFFARS
jgi:hypothetical protein